MELAEFFKDHPKVALAFSGGVDSSYLLYAALQNGADVHAYYVKSAFQPQFELEDAQKLAKQVGAKLTIMQANVLANETVVANPKNRCYYCKQVIFTGIGKQAAQDGYTTLLDGTNASDDAADRPGMKALQELSVLSPLRLCGLTKTEIRKRSKAAGLFTWDKPSYACLATRFLLGRPLRRKSWPGRNRRKTTCSPWGLQIFGCGVWGIRPSSSCRRTSWKTFGAPAGHCEAAEDPVHGRAAGPGGPA